MNTCYKRPDPDTLLAKVDQEASRKRRGKLKIFFGMVAGVGKTYAMLEAAQACRREQLDVVIGIVETHDRAETEALLTGLESLPRRRLEYRNTTLHEFDLDAALARRPALILVDELAHSNAPGSRHQQRYQDVEELLRAGIDVYSTMNVQHIESLNDIVAQITGVHVRETVPDSLIDEADEVALIDLPPDDLLQRLKEGKVYVPEQASRALQGFFRKGNLIALRELALRCTADRVDAEMRDYRERYAIVDTWPVRERILVGIGPGPMAEKLVRAGKRLAGALHAEWLVAYVETPKLMHLPQSEREIVLRSLQLAARLGVETLTLAGGQTFSQELLALAHTRNVSKIVVGSPTRRGWRRMLFGSVVDTMIDEAGDIDVYVLSAQAEMAATLRSNPVLARSRAYLEPTAVSDVKVWRRRARYLAATAIMALSTLFAWPMAWYLKESNLVMFFLLGIVIVAVRYGQGPSILASVLGVASFDFFFVPPYLSFDVADTQYLLTFSVMLVIALLISNLTAGMRLQARVAAHRERRTAALYAMTRELAMTRGVNHSIAVGVRHISEMFECQTVILLPDKSGRLSYPSDQSLGCSLRGVDLALVKWVYDRQSEAGPGTDTLPGADAIYLPLTTPNGPLGVVAVLPANLHSLALPEQRHLLETFTAQVALAIERALAAEDAQATQVKIEQERLRNTLLSGISHDLRTPLAVIIGSSSSLLETEGSMDTASQRNLLSGIYDEATRISKIVANLLEMTRFESGQVRLNKQWIPVEEVVGSVLTRLAKQLRDWKVNVTLPADLPLVPFDSGLIEQVLLNLLDNAIKYGAKNTPIGITAEQCEASVVISVANRGSGLSPGDESRVFDKFYRARSKGPIDGVGLGLSICRAIIEAHDGQIWADNRPEQGVRFRFSLPLGAKPPDLALDIEEVAGE
jgi:two-component system, OmpR family, sensor histidine kinase KdpD